MSTSPPIDKRDFEALLKEITQRVPFYTPEWKVTDERDINLAVLKIFAQMLADTIQRLNQVPNKNFIAFLDNLGVNLLPAVPARVPITFYLSNGTTIPVLIPPRTQVAANSEDGGEPIAFETEKTILATPAKLIDAYSVNPQNDEVFRVPPGFLSEEAIVPFIDRLLFLTKLGEKKLFLSKKAELEIGELLKVGEDNLAEYVEVAKVTENKAELQEALQKEHESGATVQKVIFFELFAGKNQQNHIIYLGHKNLFQIKNPVIIKLFISQWNNILANKDFLTWEYYGKVDNSEEQDWLPFDSFIKDESSNFLILRKTDINEFIELEVNSIKTFWIRGRVLSFIAEKEKVKNFNDHLEEIKIDTIRAIVESINNQSIQANAGIQPDLLFYNDIPLALKDFYPFGQKPRLFDTFYLASQAAFSQKNAKVSLDFSVEISIVAIPSINETLANSLKAVGINFISEFLNTKPEEIIKIPGIDQTKFNTIFKEVTEFLAAKEPVLSWEYWNGTGWVKLNLEPASVSENFISPVQPTIEFICPADIAEIAVNGQTNYWIRVRLVSGDYGREIFSVGANNEITSTDNFYPPLIKDIQITYKSSNPNENGFPLEVCLTLNNLTFQNRTEESKTIGKPFQPFQTLEDSHQALYLGFDTPPIKGPISLFADLEIQEYTEQNRPRVEWQYFRLLQGKGEWTSLNPIDGTNHLTQSGLIQWTGQEDFALTTYFNKTLYWIRAVDVRDRFTPLERSLIENIENLFPAKIRNLAPTAPRFKGLHLNTAWAIQAESFTEQILGSSDGTADQQFPFLKSPVISEEVWVNEITALSTGERAALLTEKDDIQEEKDEDGNVTAFWVRWNAVEDLLDSNSSDRHYQIDQTFGILTFGNGIEGAIPPIGTDNIRANYQAGGGKKGNVTVSTINILKSAIAFVDRATNWVIAEGGTDTELVEQALKRGPQQIRHQNRAVTVRDFEQLALQASRRIARVKCLPNFNDEGETKTGWVTVLLVPQSADPQPQLSPILRQQVENYLRDRSANVVTAPKHLVVTRPVYVEISVSTSLIAQSIDQVPQVEQAALKELNDFLHPLTGGYNNQGWEFGCLPCLSDFYQILEAIEGVDHVDLLKMKPDPASPDTKIEPFFLVSSGQHQVTVQSLQEVL